MNAKLILLAVAVAVIAAGTLIMCDDSDAAAGDVLASGSCGESLTFEVISLNANDSHVKLVISGEGSMEDYTQYARPWHDYRQKITSIDLPEGLTRIGNYAFNYLQMLSSIDLPESLTSIGENAFYEAAISHLQLPESLTSIGNMAFRNMTQLLSIELPESLTSIGSRAFNSCSHLASIELPAGITYIGDNAFNGCRALTRIVLPAGITTISESTFSGCINLASIELPASLTRINQNAFNSCSALRLSELPAGLTVLGSSAFYGCVKITDLTMPAIGATSSPGFTNLISLTYTTTHDWNRTSEYIATPQYNSRATLQSITFASDYIPTNALYGQDLDTLTITNASGDDFLGIYTSPTTRATAEDLTVTGTAAYIVRLTGLHGSAELIDGEITTNDVTVSWGTTPQGYATGPVDASPEVLIYPAKIGNKSPYSGLFDAIPLIVIVAIITTIIGMMAVRRD